MSGNESIIIKGGRIINPAGSSAEEFHSEVDIKIVNGTVTEIKNKIKTKSDDAEIDASGLWILPGFIDMHTHLRDLGQSDRETVGTGTRSAAAGGYTTVVAMANTDPPVDSALVMARMRELISKYACIQVLPVACVTKNMAGVELTNMVELSDMGAIAFSDDGMPISDLAVLRRALEYAELTGKFIISHPEDKALSAGGAMNEGAAAIQLGLPGVPTVSESACIAREIEVARYTGGKIHFAHVSAAASVELIRRAKEDGLRVTADCTPHHLFLTDEDITDFDACYKMNPPLRSRVDQDALIQGLRDGTIDAIATDHAPHSHVEKLRTFVEAPFGVIGLETAFPLVLERLTTEDPLIHLEVISMFTSNPAKILGIKEPRVAAGSPASLSLFDPGLKWTYEASQGYSKSKNSPFSGRRLKGKTMFTIYNGQVVYHDESHAQGRYKRQAVGV